MRTHKPTASCRGSLTGLPGHRVRIRFGPVTTAAAHRRAAGDGCPYERNAPNANAQTHRLL